MTNEHRDDASAEVEDVAAVPDLHLRLTAAVTIIDNTDTRVEAPSLEKALRIIRTHHTTGDMPLLSLADSHRTTVLFTRDQWLVMPTKVSVLAKDIGRSPDYRLLYHSWQLAEDGSEKTMPVKVSALQRIAHAAADASGQPVVITSGLLGFAETRVEPGEITADDADTTPEESEEISILDTLDDELFDLPTHHPDTEEEEDEPHTPATPEPAGFPGAVPTSTLPVEEDDLDDTAPTSEEGGFTLAEVTEALDENEDTDTDSAQHHSWDEKATEDTRGSGAALPRSSRVRRALRRVTPEFYTLLHPGVAFSIVGFFLIVFVVAFFAFRPATGAAGMDDDWVTTPATPEEAGTTLDADYGQELWTLPASEAETLSWFTAGVVSIEDDELTLYDTVTGEQTAGVDLADPVDWAAEFTVEDTDTVGIRAGGQFIAITAEGDVQRWDIDEDDQVTVYGTTPLVFTDEGTSTLIFGEDQPVSVSPNPDLITSAADGDELIQVAAGGTPRIVTSSIQDDGDAEDITLEAPTEDATFTQHLSVGHGLAVAEWEVDGAVYLGVHDLEDSPGEATAYLPSNNDPGDGDPWTIGRGMDLALVEDYAIELATGEPAAHSPDERFTDALGPAAISESSSGRTFTLENLNHNETTRIIGYTGNGTVLLRETDGSVTAYGQTNGGTA